MLQFLFAAIIPLHCERDDWPAEWDAIGAALAAISGPKCLRSSSGGRCPTARPLRSQSGPGGGPLHGPLPRHAPVLRGDGRPVGLSGHHPAAGLAAAETAPDALATGIGECAVSGV